MVGIDTLRTDENKACFSMLRRSQFQSNIYSNHLSPCRLYCYNKHPAERSFDTVSKLSLIYCKSHQLPPFRDEETGLVVDVFNTSPVMSTYLNIFVVSKFAYLENSAYNYRVYAREEAIETALYTLYIAPRILEYLEEFTNITYLYSGIGKLDQIAVPDFSAGAMENWGLITYR